MEVQPTTPSNWFTAAIAALQWPVIVMAAFALGRYVKALEHRVLNAEKNVKDLIERHMPHIHKALGEIAAAVETIKALVQGRR